MSGRTWICVLALCIGACSSSGTQSASPAASPLGTAEARYWLPDEGRVFPARLDYPNEAGVLTTLNVRGPTETKGHPFFTPLGTNSRACITCHQPSDGMGLSAATAQAAWKERGAADPLFEAIDGSNCPNLPQADAASHSLLLQHGLIRIVRPWPPRAADGTRIEPEFTLEVLRDPTGCNREPGSISVYRRPRPAANLKYATAIGFAFDPKNGLPLQLDPVTGQPTSGNLLADVRALTLEGQAIDALASHLQLHGAPDAEQLRRIIEFENQLYTAQSSHATAGSLSEGGAQGGPDFLVTNPAGALQSTATPIWSEFTPWKMLPPPAAGTNDPAYAMRQSIARGAELFSKRMFLVTDSAGITDTGFGNPVRNSCAFCHNMRHVGLDVAPGQVDLGTVNLPFARLPASNANAELPLFRLTCSREAAPHPHLGRVIYTHDPGYALSTGRCIDIGKITAQSLRGLAGRAPFFANGSARTLREVIDYYDERYTIELTEQEKDDLTHLLEVL
ncbi:MAG TPA: hypothetical protein VJR89_02415 [Polyangiales bacterium]|nr:hypothetical protein [Polyangiales bacterium]